MQKRMAFMIVFFGLMGAAGLAEIADGWIVEQVSDSGYIEPYTKPQISQGNIAWLEYRDGKNQVFFWDGNIVQPISELPGDCGDPRISGNHVTWRQYNGGITQIMLYNGSDTMQLTSGNNYRLNPSISGSHVVWIETIGTFYTVVLWDGTNTQPLSSNVDCSEPVADANQIAWVENYKKIQLWDDSETTVITQSTDYTTQLRLSDNQIIWLETDELDLPEAMGKVMLWDGNSVQQLSDGANCSQPCISQGHAAWIENNQIMYWNGSTVSSLTANSKRKTGLTISQNRVIWSEQPGLVPVFLLYLWDSNTLVRFTDMPGCGSPAIWQDRIAWLAYDDDYDMQVFFARPGTIPAAIPGDINQDQSVNILDFSILADNWLKSSASGG